MQFFSKKNSFVVDYKNYSQFKGGNFECPYNANGMRLATVPSFFPPGTDDYRFWLRSFLKPLVISRVKDFSHKRNFFVILNFYPEYGQLQRGSYEKTKKSVLLTTILKREKQSNLKCCLTKIRSAFCIALETTHKLAEELSKAQ